MAENPEPVSRRIKFILSLGEFAPSVATGTIIPFYFLFFLTDVAGIRPGAAGTLLLIARLWDAVNDPLVGNLSDRTRSRWGRRRPYMLFGSVPMGILFALLWLVPPWGTAAQSAYYLVIYLLFDTLFTIVLGPYVALTPELTLDADERTSIITWRMAVSIITGLVAAVSMDLVFSALPDLRTSFAIMGAVVGLLSILPFLWIVAVVRERSEHQQHTPFRFFEGLRMVITNRPFLLSLAADTLVWTTIALVAGVFAYYLIYWSGIAQEDSPLIMAVILTSAALFLPLVSWLSERFEKKWAFVICTAIWAAVHAGLWFVPQHVVAPVFVIAALAGLGVSAAHVLPGSMGIDVLEAVELQSGQRREGVFLGVGNFLRKTGISVALFLLGWTLELTRYVPNAETQPAVALTSLRVLVSWVPVVLLLLAILATVLFPITRAVHARMLVELAERRAQSLAG